MGKKKITKENNTYIIGKSNVYTIGENHNKYQIICALMNGYDIVIMDDGEEYKSLSEQLLDSKG